MKFLKDFVMLVPDNTMLLNYLQVCIYAGALFIKLSLGWDMYMSIGVLLAITCVYTALGMVTLIEVCQPTEFSIPS
jgi:hypothetical protein